MKSSNPKVEALLKELGEMEAEIAARREANASAFLRSVFEVVIVAVLFVALDGVMR